jgi:hypothetical protein
MNSHDKWDNYNITIMVIVTIKQGKFKGGKLYDVPTCCMKFLKYDPFW